ncbi:MAG: D-alanyl-D-alanine carboxypeptidase family protein [Lachnospiraceae bacterium]
MKCINNKMLIALFTIFSVIGAGCGSQQPQLSYEEQMNNTSFSVINQDVEKIADSFATSLCVGNANITANTNQDMSDVEAAGLFDLSNKNIIYAKNIHEQLEPASLTKVLTAIVALKYGDLNDSITATSNVIIRESGAQTCGLKEGDVLTLNQALHALLIYSANDAAIAIAEHISGSVEEFAVLMNNEAKLIGATNSMFQNPHGLTQTNHYTTAYDMYLIFNTAIQFELFNEIISRLSYETIYHNSSGDEKTMSLGTTNLFLKGTYNSPEKITVVGGKTGTTTAARSCLVLLSRDISGNPYISVLLKAKERVILYNEMVNLLEEIYN